jgi:hypothetical protein
MAIWALAVAVLVAGGDSDRRLPDFVMIDDRCKMLGSQMGSEESPVSMDASTLIHVCFRSARTVTCRQQTTQKDDKVQASEAEYTAIDMPPKLFLTGTKTQSTIYVDWSRSRYMLAFMSIDAPRSAMFQKQCTGTIMTGEALAERMAKERQKK